MIRPMGLLHRDEPVTDATVNCPQCGALDWVVRSPRLGGEAKLACRTCGYVDGPYFEPGTREHDPPEPAIGFYAPEGLEWEVAGGWERSVTVTAEDPWVVVTTEAEPSEPAEALRDAIADLLGSEDPPPGRSHAAYLLEAGREDERIEAIVEDLFVERGTLRVDGVDVPAQTMRYGDAWAAYAIVDGQAVIASTRAGAQAVARIRSVV